MKCLKCGRFKNPLESKQAAQRHIRDNFKKCYRCRKVGVQAAEIMRGPRFRSNRTAFVESWRLFFNHIVIYHEIPLEILSLALGTTPGFLYKCAQQPYYADKELILDLVRTFGPNIVFLRSEPGAPALREGRLWKKCRTQILEANRQALDYKI
jgi:hypothetical protein